MIPHAEHYICPHHYRLHLEGTSPAICCACHDMKDCLDEFDKKRYENLKKNAKDERDIVKAQGMPEYYGGE